MLYKLLVLLALASAASAVTFGAIDQVRSDGFRVAFEGADGSSQVSLDLVSFPNTDFNTLAVKAGGGDATYTCGTTVTGFCQVTDAVPGVYNLQLRNNGNTDFNSSVSTLCTSGGSVSLNVNTALITPNLVLEFQEDMQFTAINYKFVNEAAACLTSSTWTDSAGADTSVCASPVSTVTIPINLALQHCGFTIDEATPDTTTYTSTVEITTTEGGDVIRGVRYEKTVVSTIDLTIQFQTSVTANTTDVQVFGNRIAFSTVVSQSFDSTTGNGVATITLLTSVQYPYQLNLPAMETPASGWLAPTIAPQTQDATTNTAAACTDGSGAYDVGNACTQYWTITIQRDTACASSELDLTYSGWKVTYPQSSGVICHSSFTGGCDAATTNTGGQEVTFDTSSGNYCPNLIGTGSAEATLRVYSSGHESNENNQFVWGSNAYFTATVTSEVKMVNLHFEQIKIISGGSSGLSGGLVYSKTFTDAATFFTAPVAFESEAAAANPVLANDVEGGITGTGGASDGTTTMKSQFSWTWGSSISDAQGDASSLTVVEAKLRIRYSTQAGKIVHVRQIIDPKKHFRTQNAGVVGGTNARASVGVSTGASGSSGSTLGAANSMTALVVACALVGLLLFIVVARRRKRKEEDQEIQEEEQSDSVHLALPKTENKA